jgi:hypothetical protein
MKAHLRKQPLALTHDELDLVMPAQVFAQEFAVRSPSSKPSKPSASNRVTQRSPATLALRRMQSVSLGLDVLRQFRKGTCGQFVQQRLHAVEGLAKGLESPSGSTRRSPGTSQELRAQSSANQGTNARNRNAAKSTRCTAPCIM